MPTTARTIVITGASRGLGAGMAEAFHRQGHRLGLCSRSTPVLAGEERVLARELDATDGEAVAAFGDAVAEAFGGIDLWINNAGLIEPIAPLRDCEPGEWCQLLRVNVEGVFHGSRWMARHLRERGGEGALVNISSGAAQHAYAGWSGYCASKAAVDRLSEALAMEEDGSGLRVLSIAPGVIDTGMQESIRGSAPEDFPAVDKFHELKRREAFNTPAYVAARLLEHAFDPAHIDGPVVRRLEPQGS